MKLKLMTALCVSVLAASAAYADVDISPAAAQGVSQDQHRQAGDAFLKKNKATPGVVTLADGLQYKVLTAGKGAKPTEQDVVTVEYAGKLIDGTEFDSSAKHGGTIDFQLGQVIPGWVEALKMMQPGSTWEIFIPSDLAYGETGAPPAIGPNETLIFKVKLVSFKKAA